MNRVAVPLLGLLLASLLVWAGCGPKPQSEATTGEPQAAPRPAPAASKPAETKTETMNAPTADAIVPITEAPAAPPAAPPPFGWSAFPAMESIPAKPLEGSLQGKPFKPAKVVLELKDGKPFRLRFIATEDIDSAQAGDLIEAVYMPDSSATGAGPWTKQLDKDPGSASAYYRYVNASEDVATMQSAWAAALSIDGGLSAATAGGKVKGKALFCFGDDAQSFFGGEFEAEVR